MTKRPFRLSPDDVLNILRDLPGHRGCDQRELDDAEQSLGVTLPRFYCDLMLLDASRLYQTGVFIPLRELKAWTDEAPDVLREYGLDYGLAPNDVIFAIPNEWMGWDSVSVNYFFRADGTYDPPVCALIGPHDCQGSNLVADTLSYFVSQLLRDYLKLDV